MKKLKASEVAQYRATALEEQGGHCMLCCDRVASEDAVLDHDHKTGHVRGVLHRGCNAMLGHIENNRARNMLKDARLWRFLRGVERYITADHTQRPLHPTHRTAEEKVARTKKLAAKRRAAKKVVT
jgi:hypothetical protein